MRGGAAEGRRARAGLEIVARRCAAERHVEMRVRVDAAGEQQHAGGVNDFVGSGGGNAGADFFDDGSVDEEVGAHCGVGVDDGSVLMRATRHGS